MNGLMGKLPGKCCHCGCTEIIFVNTFHLLYLLVFIIITSQQTVNSKLTKGRRPKIKQFLLFGLIQEPIFDEN